MATDTEQPVIARVASKAVQARAAIEQVVAVQLFRQVIRIAEQDIVAIPAEQRVVARLAEELIVARTTVEKIIPDLLDHAPIANKETDRARHDPQVRTGRSEPRHLVAPEVAGKHVIFGTPEELVVTFPAF